MATKRNCLVFDLGAESGRAVVAGFDGSRLELKEVHRFPNGPVRVMGSLFWDSLRIFSEIKQGLAAAARTEAAEIGSVGIDTWGVDFALLDARGDLMGNPYHYRDRRTDGMLEEAFRRVPRHEIFTATGLQFMQINTLYQLLAMTLRESALLEGARTMLMMADLFNYWLTGTIASERTAASTSQCLNPTTKAWALAMLERLGIPVRIFPEIIEPGTVLGGLLPEVASETGAAGVRAIAGGCHDTASAVAAVPASSDRWAYISSGTWSLLGVEIPDPIINSRALDYNFTNEGGVCGTIRFLKNIAGLWLVQECRRTWATEGRSLTYDEIALMAGDAAPFAAVVDPDDAVFLSPGDMPARIRAYWARTGQEAPADVGTMARCILESLAFKYRMTLERLEELTGRPVDTIHIVGGGSQNRLLSQFTADATARTVIAGPVEATAAGNALMQLIALGDLGSLEEGRELIRRSFDTETFESHETARWSDAYQQFLKIISEPDS